MRKYFLLGLLSLWMGSADAQESGWFPQASPAPPACWEFMDVHAIDADEVVIVGGGSTIIRTSDGGESWQLKRGGTWWGLESVYFVDSETGWAAGGNGTIVRTDNGGLSWSEQTTGTTEWLYAVHFADAQTGWAVGANGTILKTEDGGLSWHTQDGGTTQGLYAVYSVSPQTGWVVGYNGTVLETTNGGTSWQAQDSGTTQILKSVFFLNQQTGWITGSSGTILRTTNGGGSWNPQASGTTRMLQSIHFADAQTGWAVAAGSTSEDGGRIFKTTDGGASWSETIVATSYALNSVHFADAQTGWAVGQGTTIWKTSDGGASWISQGGTRRDLRSVQFLDSDTGWVVGDSRTILKTVDGGARWTSQILESNRVPLESVHFLNSSQGSAVGGLGAAFRTTDGGQTWTEMDLAFVSWIRDVQWINGSTGWATGIRASSISIDAWGDISISNPISALWRTTDGGDTWDETMLASRNWLNDSFFVDQEVGWVAGGIGVIKTADGGNSWQGLAGCYGDLESVHFTDTTRGWAVGEGGKILGTTNGGLSWSPQSSGTSLGIQSVYFIDASTGWAVGGNGLILKTTNGGGLWTPQSAGTTRSLYAVHFVSNQVGWVASSGGRAFGTTNGGQSWQEHEVASVSRTFYSVHFIDAQTGWLAGSWGDVFRTTDGGATWTEQDSGTSSTLYSVYFADAQKGWVAGSGGNLRATVDGGDTWTSQHSKTSNGLRSVYFTDAQNGWIVGDNGTVLTTVNGGDSWNKLSAVTSRSLRSVHFPASDTGWAVGSGGKIFVSSDGGQSWNEQGCPFDYLNGVHFVNAQTGWVVGREGEIFKTGNGGTSWTEQASGTTRELESVYFTDEQTGWSVGENGTIVHTTDGGQSWRLQPSGTTKDLYSVHFVDYETGWAVGEDGTILKTTNGGEPTWRLYFAQFGDGNGVFFSQIILVNPDTDQPVEVSLRIADGDGNPMLVDLNGVDITGQTTVTLPAAGSTILKTDMQGPLQAGSVTLESQRDVSCVVLFGGSFGLAGVGDSKRLRQFLAPMQSGAGLNTGVAMMGLGEDQIVQLELLDPSGNRVARASLELGAGAQEALYIDDFTWDTPPDFSNFSGSLRATGQADFAATVVLDAPNEFATLPVAQLDNTISSRRLYFAQFGDGGNALYSQITLLNLDSTWDADVSLEINDDSGNPMTVDLNGSDVFGEAEVSIPAGGSASLQTDMQGPVQAGSVRVNSNRNLSGVILFGGLVGTAGVGDSTPLEQFVAPIQTGGGLNTGVALMGLGEDQTIQLELRDPQGSVVARASLELGAKAHQAVYINNFTWDTPPDFTSFAGTLRATGESDFAATVILDAGGQFATLPVAKIN